MAGPYNIPTDMEPGDPGQINWSIDVGEAVNDINLRLDALEGVTAPGNATLELLTRSSTDCALQQGWINMVPLWLPFGSTWNRFSIQGSNNGDDGDDPTAVLKAGLYEVPSAVVGAAGTLLHNFGNITIASYTEQPWWDWEGDWAVPAGLYYVAIGQFDATASPRFVGTIPPPHFSSGSTPFQPAIPTRNGTHRRWIMTPGGSDTLPTSTGTLNTNGGGEQSYFPAVWIRTETP